MNQAQVRQAGKLLPAFGRAPPLLYGLALAILLAFAVFSARAGEEIVLAVYGDSLSAGFGVSETQTFPVRLEDALRARGHNVRVINASVSGDTTAAGLNRFEWSFPKGAQGAILELGANDALRGLRPETTRANLDALLTRIKAKGAVPLLAGMLAPRNLGVEFTSAFDRIYPELAKKHDVLLYPFFLFDVAGKRKLNLADGLHPNPAGIDKIVEQMVPVVEELLGRISARRTRTQ
ncbi:arylesterase precursor [bacterium BMS3Bbin10]|nr:arylesterase precursor [bacterium BMS3Bbin10]